MCRTKKVTRQLRQTAYLKNGSEVRSQDSVNYILFTPETAEAVEEAVLKEFLRLSRAWKGRGYPPRTQLEKQRVRSLFTMAAELRGFREKSSARKASGAIPRSVHKQRREVASPVTSAGGERRAETSSTA